MDESNFQSLLRRAFWLPALFATVLAITLVFEVGVLINRDGWVRHSDEVLSVAQHLYRLRVDQETGLRAFLMTGDARFLQPFKEGARIAPQLENHLAELISDNQSQQALNQKAVVAHKEWDKYAEDAIARKSAGQWAGSLDDQLKGKAVMDEWRNARQSFIDDEQRLKDERLQSSHNTVVVLAFAIAGECAFLAFFLTFFQRRQLVEVSKAFNASLAEIRTQREWFRTTLDSIGDGVIATDAEGKITFLNGVASELTGWSIDEAEGKELPTVFRIVNEQTRELVENPVAKVLRLNRIVGLANHTVLIHKNGIEAAIDDSGAPIRDLDGKILGVVLVFRDVTKEKSLEAALQANERLALAGRLSASIAHEIHNPLDTVGNLLFLASRQVEDRPQLRDWLGMAQMELGRVSQISKNMLSLHRELDSTHNVRVNDLLYGVVALVEETLVKGRRKIVVQPGFDGVIEAHEAGLRQIFTNLLKNAVEATQEGGQITVSSAAAHEAGTEGVMIKVSDDGVGIPPGILNKLFTPFTSTKQESGNGLGLWVSRSIVEKHGGKINISSNNPNGATVTVFLPITIPRRNSEDDATMTAD